MVSRTAVEELAARIAAAVGRVPDVLTVPAVHLGTEADGRALAAVRVGLDPALTLAEIMHVVARTQLATARLLPDRAVVFVEPDVAADRSTPTEAIVIRGAE